MKNEGQSQKTNSLSLEWIEHDPHDYKAIKTNQKIFGIGLSKTATTSLGRALRYLGYATNDFPSFRYIPHFLLWIKSKELQQHDAFTDISVIPFYQKLDKQFPGSKFIYTVRDMDSWLDSCRNYPRFQYPPMRLPFKIIKLRQKIYDSIRFDENKFREAYLRHHEEVVHYFKDRQQDLLTLNICKGDGWEKLCPFLGEKIPDVPFPYVNVRGEWM